MVVFDGWCGVSTHLYYIVIMVSLSHQSGSGAHQFSRAI
jgi:hypothetical protein